MGLDLNQDSLEEEKNGTKEQTPTIDNGNTKKPRMTKKKRGGKRVRSEETKEITSDGLTVTSNGKNNPGPKPKQRKIIREEEELKKKTKLNPGSSNDNEGLPVQSSHLEISNLDPNTTVLDLEKQFEGFGKLKTDIIHGKKGFQAKIDLETTQQAIDAREALNGSKIGINQVCIRFAKCEKMIDEKTRCPSCGEATIEPSKGEAWVGKRVRVFWTKMNAWYDGYISRYSKRVEEYKVHYDDGEIAWDVQNDMILQKELPKLEQIPEQKLIIIDKKPKIEKKMKKKPEDSDRKKVKILTDNLLKENEALRLQVAELKTKVDDYQVRVPSMTPSQFVSSLSLSEKVELFKQLNTEFAADDLNEIPSNFSPTRSRKSSIVHKKSPMASKALSFAFSRKSM
eukprot:TRINITY_DN8311_c0_g1_i1.p1 TRINITY_DN8311_c0_g1~~TRINITY_DN8311_c0_g1_i1.p1  ORF type:complete len:397 (+),score=100.01 TRINITY_DN8311_c0_g1_i1:142-1332(+)